MFTIFSSGLLVFSIFVVILIISYGLGCLGEYFIDKYITYIYKNLRRKQDELQQGENSRKNRFKKLNK